MAKRYLGLKHSWKKDHKHFWTRAEEKCFVMRNVNIERPHTAGPPVSHNYLPDGAMVIGHMTHVNSSISWSGTRKYFHITPLTVLLESQCNHWLLIIKLQLIILIVEAWEPMTVVHPCHVSKNLKFSTQRLKTKSKIWSETSMGLGKLSPHTRLSTTF